MQELAVLILATDDEQRSVLQMQVEGSAVARTRAVLGGFPLGTKDPILRRIQDEKPDVVLLDIPARDPGAALQAIEVLHSNLPLISIFAVGEMNQPLTIVEAMRAGAKEFLGRPTSNSSLVEAFVRLKNVQQRTAAVSGHRGKVVTVINSKGGCGATTIAVNTALSLHAQGSVALLDLAVLGHVALQLNLRPDFTWKDAMRNLHRLDGTLLDGLMAKHPVGVHLLAGTSDVNTEEPTRGEFARLFDLLVSRYRHIVVDVSTRLDSMARMACDLADDVLLVSHPDVVSLWSAAKVQELMGTAGNSAKMKLVLNRYRKIPGFTDNDVEHATRLGLHWKIPNQYPLISTSIDRGMPVSQQNHSEIARTFLGLANSLTKVEAVKKEKWQLLRGA